jgi:hypothetical protein
MEVIPGAASCFHVEFVLMATDIQSILQSFDLLPDSQKREVAFEIVRRSLQLDTPPLSDDDLVSAADDLFLQLDRNEGGDG